MYSHAHERPLRPPGLLEQQPRHGYDLKRLFDRYFAPDHPLAFAQVYSTLGRLEQRGRVRLDAIERAEGPERRRYAITEVGTKELERWLEEPLTGHAQVRFRRALACRRLPPVNASTHTIVPVARSDALAIAQVDLDAIAANVSWFVTRARGASLMAVVKADAFGHGAVQVANAALRAGATWLGVARIEEALALREAGISAPILAWILDPAWIAAAVDRSVDLSASSIADLYCIAAAASVSTPPGAIPQVHLKLDTGLHRAGVPSGDWASAVGLAARLETAGHLRVRGVWSHLSHGDVWDHPANEVQAARLAAGIRVARRAGLRPDVTHLANSGGVDQLGAMGCSMVRVGAGLYGIDVFDGAAGTSSLRPALTLSARIIGVRTLASGEGVAYGHEWVTARSTRLALVPVGYADGLPRNGGNLARFLAGGQLVPLAGRVSMDQVTIDVTGVEAGVGDAVTIIGDGTDGAPTTMDWARWTGTIPHEVLTGIGPRIPRVARGRTA